MADVTKSHGIFLGFCKEALERIEGDHSFEAGKLRVELEALVRKLESWVDLHGQPPDKEATLAAVLEAYRKAQEISAARNA